MIPSDGFVDLLMYLGLGTVGVVFWLLMDYLGRDHPDDEDDNQ